MNKTNHYSSLNQTAAINTNKVAHLGKNYADIDFEIKELNNIMRTANDAMNLCDQSYRMGSWGKATR